MTGKRYNVSLGSDLDRDLDDVATKLGVSKAEAMRRALMLFKHAVEADEVKFTKDGEDRVVLIK